MIASAFAVSSVLGASAIEAVVVVVAVDVNLPSGPCSRFFFTGDMDCNSCFIFASSQSCKSSVDFRWAFIVSLLFSFLVSVLASDLGPVVACCNGGVVSSNLRTSGLAQPGNKGESDQDVMTAKLVNGGLLLS